MGRSPGVDPAAVGAAIGEGLRGLAPAESGPRPDSAATGHQSMVAGFRSRGQAAGSRAGFGRYGRIAFAIT